MDLVWLTEMQNKIEPGNYDRSGVQQYSLALTKSTVKIMRTSDPAKVPTWKAPVEKL